MKRRDIVKGMGFAAVAAMAIATNAVAATNDIVENRLKIIDALMDKQNKMAQYIDFYIYMYGRVPTLNNLKSSGILHTAFANDFASDSSFSANNQAVTIVTRKPKTKQYEIDYYNNRTGGVYAIRNASLDTSTGQGTFQAQYPLSAKAMRSKNYRDKGYLVSATPPNASANNGRFWFNPLTGVVSYSTGGIWQNLSAVKTLYTLRSTAELPSSAVNGDVAIVIDVTKPASQQFQKYMYVNGSWRLLPPILPFSYNGRW